MITESQKFKFKPITDAERAVYLRRLIRFKYPPDKKSRVYRQILTAHTIEPKISKKIYDALLPAQIDEMVSIIWNNGLDGDFAFNQRLLADDVRCFDSRKMLEDMLSVRIDEDTDLCKVFESCGYVVPCGAKTYDDFYFALQGQFPLIFKEVNFPQIQKVILVEGATEEILLPHFLRLLGYDFVKEGVFLIASGGKNQVVKDYLFHRENLNLKIAVILDADAKEQCDSIRSVLRSQDDILLLEEGEFEDLLSQELILKALNCEFKNTAHVSSEDLAGDLPMTQKLYELYKIKGFGEFKKVEFAKLVYDTVSKSSDLGESFLRVADFVRS